MMYLLIKSVKLLGFLLYSKLSWSDHINLVFENLLSNKTFKTNVTRSHPRMIYFLLFQIIINNGILIWGNSHYTTRVLLLRKKD